MSHKMQRADSRRRLEQLLVSADSVVLYRQSPGQKAEVVHLLQSRGANVLAVGDGGNDVSMITAADVGVGIHGNEGTSAAVYSDFAIAKFKHLRRLLFWHGRTFMWRNAVFINHVMFRGVLWCFGLYIFNTRNGFSGVSPVESYLVMMVAIMLCTHASSWQGVFDQNAQFVLEKDEHKLDYDLSRLYAHDKTFSQNLLSSYRREMLFGLLAAMFQYTVYCMIQYDTGLINSEGDSLEFYQYGITHVISLTIIFHIRIALSVRNWNVLMLGIFLLSLSALPFNLFVENIRPQSCMQHALLEKIFMSPQMLLSMGLVISSTSLLLYAALSIDAVLYAPQFYRK